MSTSAVHRPAELAALPHSGLSVREFYSMHFLAALLPLACGLVMFGWRAVMAVFLVCGSTAAGVAVWRRIGPRGQQLSYPHALWTALLLSMMLPAHLASDQLPGSNDAPWLLLVAAGLILAMFLWLLGGVGAGRIHPALVTYLLLVVFSLDLLVPRYVLQRNHLVTGDILKGKASNAHVMERESWTSREQIPGQDSQMSEPAAAPLSLFTRGRPKPARGAPSTHAAAGDSLPAELAPQSAPQSMQSLLRDDLPPLEDLVVGGHPAPIGTGSAIAVLIGGLFLLYNGVIDFRIPLIILLVEFACLLIFPIPTAVRSQTTWYWLVSRQPGLNWSTGITFANYEMMASPAFFMAFFLATSPSIRPMSRRARVIYSILAGAGSAAMQLYLSALIELVFPAGGANAAAQVYPSVAVGPYVALLLASALTPVLGMWFRARPLV